MRLKSKEIKLHGLSLPEFAGAGRQSLSRVGLVPCDDTLCGEELALALYPYYSQSLMGFEKPMVLQVFPLGGGQST